MKKFLLVPAFAVAVLGAAVSCDNNDDDQVVTTDTYPQMRDIRANLASPNFSTVQNLDIPTTDVVLVYRNVNSNISGGAVWQLLPKTFYLGNGRELDYNFLFNSQQVEIYSEANFDQTTMSAAESAKYLNNQQFRIVLVPASASKNASVNYEDYDSVVRYFNLNESQVK